MYSSVYCMYIRMDWIYIFVEFRDTAGKDSELLLKNHVSTKSIFFINSKTDAGPPLKVANLKKITESFPLNKFNKIE